MIEFFPFLLFLQRSVDISALLTKRSKVFADRNSYVIPFAFTILRRQAKLEGILLVAAQCNSVANQTFFTNHTM